MNSFEKVIQLTLDQSKPVRRTSRHALSEKPKPRERLLLAATEHFATYGFDASGIRDIAKEAGVTAQLITYHFANKDGLWIACLEAALKDAISRMAHTAEAVRSCAPAERDKYFRAWLSAYFTLNAKQGTYRRIITHEYLADSDRFKKIILPIVRQITSHYKAVIRECIDIGLITRLSFEEVITLIPVYAASNALMPYEIEMLTSRKPDSKSFIEWEVNLVMKLIFGSETN